MVKKEIDINTKPTKKQIEMLTAASQKPVIYDEECPEFTDKELAEFNTDSVKFR